MLFKEVNNLVVIIKTSFRYSLISSVVILFYKLLAAVIPTIKVLIIARFIDIALSVINSKLTLSELFIPAIILIAVIAYEWLSSQYINLFYAKLEINLRNNFRTLITEKIAKLEYKNIENESTWNLISRVTDKPETKMRKAYIETLTLGSILLRIFGIIIIISAKVWWIGIIVSIFTIPLLKFAYSGAKKTYASTVEVSRNIRMHKYLSQVLLGRDAACERTLFDYCKEINKKWMNEYDISRRVQFKSLLKYFMNMKLSSSITSIITVLIILILIPYTLNNVLTIGMFIAIVNGLLEMIRMMSWELSYHMKEISRNVEYIKDINTLFLMSEDDGAIELPSLEPKIFDSIEFIDVSFKYPDTDNYILRNLSFKIDKGNHYAFVGVNGAGKTTIIKLLTGLYKEYEGHILINNTNLKQINYSELKSLFSIVYQDFAKYSISIEDNLLLGNIFENENDIKSRITKGLESMDLNIMIKNLKQGIKTQLGKIHTNGHDLSGGQWQKLILARTIISKAELKILDEPTASLDPIIENRIYEKFKKINENCTTIIISHRLGSTKLADKIFVLSNGCIKEEGTHKSLLDIKGIYSELYESQRSWYVSE